ncbi:MAG: hypothetical protein KGZ96_13570 [Clostridia bacterium]|jgi:hypothetical protein|nr:hypothetical protein [Clostridia bacterium]
MEAPIGRKLSDAEIAYYRSLAPAQKVQLTYELTQLLKKTVIIGKKEVIKADECSKQHD